MGCFGAASDEALRAAPTSIFDATGFDDAYKDTVKVRKLDSDRFPARNKLAASKTLAASRGWTGLCVLQELKGLPSNTRRNSGAASLLEPLMHATCSSNAAAVVPSYQCST